MALLTQDIPLAEMMAPTRRLIIAAVIALATLPAYAATSAVPLDADRVKAAFLFNFAKFVTWPASHGPRGPLMLGVVGDELGDLLQEVVTGKTIQGRDVMVRRFRDGDDLRECHLLFIGASQTARTKELLLKVQGASVLTVGETQHFLREGGVIRFFVEENRVRFQIDAARAEQAGLKINSQLLSLATR